MNCPAPMAPLTAFEKRIKRNITGREQEFFIVTAPGLEQLCYNELLQLPLSSRKAAVVEGGIEFSGRLHDCYLANLHLRLANRIIMRIGSFKASNFQRLGKKMSGIPWELYLHRNCALTVSVTSRHSRLYHKDAVSECCREKIAQRLALYAPEPNPVASGADAQQLFVRIVEDHFTLSLDSSGELLHKRGLKSHRAAAPLRETIAAAILKIAGFTEDEPLIDPLCGSGTFSLEAAMLVKQIPPGWFRDFAFMGWPGFLPGRWHYARRQSETFFAEKKEAQIFASDRDEAVCSELRDCVERYHLTDAVQVRCMDFFKLDPSDVTAQSGLVVLNPPYGMRLGERAEAAAFIAALCRKLKRSYAGWKLALLVSDASLLDRIPLPNLTRHRLFHGGLRALLLTGRI
jgi:putative N6-adenine-specific DNA methylase